MIDPATLSFIASAVVFITKYGIPAAQDIIHELEDKHEPTLADIDAIAARMKPPEEYFILHSSKDGLLSERDRRSLSSEEEQRKCVESNDGTGNHNDSPAVEGKAPSGSGPIHPDGRFKDIK